MTSDIALFDRTVLRQRRERAVGSDHDARFLLDAAADDMASRLGAVMREFPVAADLTGIGGVLARRVLETGKIGCLISTELTQRLAEKIAPVPGAGHACAVADDEALPFADESLDLVVSGLALQWVNDLPGTLIQIRRALKPDGLFLAALVGGSTLSELRSAFLKAEAELTGGAAPRVAPAADVRDLGGLLQRAGFALPVVDSDTLTVRYGSPLGLMRDLRAMGATSILGARSRTPLRRDVLQRVLEVYATDHADPDGRVRATFEIVSLSGWAPHDSQQKPLRPGSARMRLADALGTSEESAGEKAGTPEQD